MNGYIERGDERRRRAAQARAGLPGTEVGSPSASASPRSPLSYGQSSPSAMPFYFSESSADAYSSCRQRAACLQAEAAESRDKASCLRMGAQRSRLLSLAAMKETQAEALRAAADAAEREAALVEERESGRRKERREERPREERGRFGESDAFAPPRSPASPAAKSQRSSGRWSGGPEERCEMPREVFADREDRLGREYQRGLDREVPTRPETATRDEDFETELYGGTRLRETLSLAGAFPSRSGENAEEQGGRIRDAGIASKAEPPSRAEPPWVRRAQALRLEAAEHRDRAQCVRGSKQRGLLIIAEKKEREAEALLASHGREPRPSQSITPPAGPEPSFDFHEAWATSEASVRRRWDLRPESSVSASRLSRGSPEDARFRPASCREEPESVPLRRGAVPDPAEPPFRSARDGFPEEDVREAADRQRLVQIRQLQEEAACARDKAVLVRGAKQRALIKIAEHREQQAELLMRDGEEQLERAEAPTRERGDERARPASADMPPWLRDEQVAKSRTRRSEQMEAIPELDRTRDRPDPRRAAMLAPAGDACSDDGLPATLSCLSPHALSSLSPHVVSEIHRLSREVDVLRDKAACCSGAKARQLRSMADIKERQVEDLVRPPPPRAPPGGPQLAPPASAASEAAYVRGASGKFPVSWPGQAMLGTRPGGAEPQVPSGAVHSPGVQLRVPSVSGVPPQFEVPSEKASAALGGANSSQLGDEQTERRQLSAGDLADENHPLADSADWQRYNQLLREAREHRGKAACVGGARQRQLLAIAAAKERLAGDLKVKVEEALPPGTRLDALGRIRQDQRRVSSHGREESPLVLPPPRLTRFTTGEEPGSPEEASDDVAVEASRFACMSPRVAQVVSEGRVRRGGLLQRPPYLVAGGPDHCEAPAPRLADAEEPPRPTLEELKRQHELLQEQLHLVEEQLQLHRERQAHEEQRRRLEAMEKLEREEREAAKQLSEETDADDAFLKRQDPHGVFPVKTEQPVAPSRTGTQEEGDLAATEETPRLGETGDGCNESQKAGDASDSGLDPEDGQAGLDDASSKQSWTLAEDDADEGA
ncbi:conserved hypothetical protein [Neospora caninum Liverpool]|uniref:Uncharacterized protein n=1 Tax=Neospora caninum (strain Liverpool) TaxID=572307 RepID=F0VNT3_NEOCL|nr:conserved hypothetical protein [Neospora caninum Liverpool]CBZ55379.1 conserved hypothetical protein [Neospora caninum Liverpool]CEL70115.1 TPA: hypothetical protein BN1204_058020 [Neospora caninum Liverpool]|eukprot:XP_003885407.1 conserved hypothetical protein [Neospora caninum Liverpool]